VTDVEKSHFALYLGMKKAAAIEFSELEHSQSPKTVREMIDSAQIVVTINRWGDELTERTPVEV
jgi:hypothetical protein